MARARSGAGTLTRWGKQSIYGKALFAQVAELRTVDKYTVQMQLKEKSAIVLVSLAVPNNFGAIYPKEIADKFPPETKATEYVGTGPFRLAEWKPDQYIRMRRATTGDISRSGAIGWIPASSRASRTACA